MTTARILPCLVTALLAAVLVLAGCGQKGDLYLPDREDQGQQPRR